MRYVPIEIAEEWDGDEMRPEWPILAGPAFETEAEAAAYGNRRWKHTVTVPQAEGPVEDPVGRILRMWHLSGGKPSHWYRDTAQYLKDPKSIAVASAISPRISWEKALEFLPTVMRRQYPIGLLGRSRRNAFRIMDGEDPLKVMPEDTAPKTNRFFRNLLGDHSVVTVDSWASRIAGIPLGTYGRYLRAEEAYQEAAALVGFTGPEVQAATWEWARGLTRKEQEELALWPTSG